MRAKQRTLACLHHHCSLITPRPKKTFPAPHNLNGYKKLTPFKDELRKVRNRIGFHGSLTRSHEKAGLGIFDLESPRGREFANLIRDMLDLAPKMIKWHLKRMKDSDLDKKIGLWKEIGGELTGYTINRSL